MLAKENPVVAEAAKTIYRVNAEEQARQLCIAVERQVRTQKTYEEQLAEKDAKLADKDTQLVNANTKIAELLAKVAELEANK